jgi:hypothetical protein
VKFPSKVFETKDLSIKVFIAKEIWYASLDSSWVLRFFVATCISILRGWSELLRQVSADVFCELGVYFVLFVGL